MAQTARWYSKRLLAWLWALVAAPLFFGASVAWSLGLEEAVQLALAHDARLRGDTAAAKAERAEGAIGVAAYGPRLSASGDYRHSKERLIYDPLEGQSAGHANYDEWQWRLSFSQPLIDLEKLAVARRGLTEMDIGRLREKLATDDLLLKVHEQFYAALSAREKLETASGESEALRQSAEEARERLSQGAGTITDQDDAEARWRMALATKIAARTEYENTIKALAETVGQPCDDLEADCQDCPLPEPGEDLDYWRRQAETANTGLLITQLQYRVAELMLKEKKGRFLPSLSAFANYSHRDSDGGLPGYGDEREEMDAGLRLEMDLFAGGADTAAVIAASNRRDEARERLTETKRSLDRSLVSLWDSLQDGKALTDASRQAAEASQRALTSTKTSYDEGLRTLLDLLNAQREYYRSLEQYRTSRYDYLTLMARFRNVTGNPASLAPAKTTTPNRLPEH